MSLRVRRWLACALLAIAPALHAASFHAQVTHVTDGDTLWVRPDGAGRSIELRLLDVDAPESCQAFGAQAAQALRQRVLHAAVWVRTKGSDSYGRQLARVEHRHEDLGRWLVANGYAWAMRFRGRPGRHGALEEQARRERRGLWASPGALEPRLFRQRFGPCPVAR
jgi:endonuclease YncB( thermonuclease family)